MVPCYADCAGMDEDDRRAEINDLRERAHRGDSDRRKLNKAIDLFGRGNPAVDVRRIVDLEVDLDHLRDENTELRMALRKIARINKQLRDQVQTVYRRIDQILGPVEKSEEKGIDTIEEDRG